MRRAARIDANQPGIVKALRKIPGMSVVIIGRPVDLAVGYGGKSYLFEIKDPAKPPSKRCLTPDQVEFFLTWSGHVEKVETVDEILATVLPHPQKQVPSV